MKQQFTIGSFGIITDDNDRILLCLRNDYPIWNLPGGGVENAETPWQAVIREVKEETGIDVEVEKLIGVYSKPETNDVAFSFKCKFIGGTITLTEESRDIKYFHVHEIPENTSQKQIERIHDYFRQENEVFMKAQYGRGIIDLEKSATAR
jgi:8-oxo-dGTP diphosphatase